MRRMGTQQQTSAAFDQDTFVPLRRMGTLPHFSTNFTKGAHFCNLLFAFMDNETLCKEDQLLKERILLLVEQILCLGADSKGEGR